MALGSEPACGGGASEYHDQSFETRYPPQIPTSPPTIPRKIDHRENHPAPQSAGMKLPTVEPTVSPSMIRNLEFISLRSTPRRGISTGPGASQYALALGWLRPIP